ncbi:MAG TPA: ABC transporter permease [Ktedonobacteraceae bacterium]|nr:ABC transporter permease [Ktedonobacteraceae bacterium]
MQGPGYTLRVILACMKKDIKSALSERIFTILSIVIPVNFLILMSLFVLAGSHAPTAVVMNDTGPYARQFYDAMDHAHSFSLRQATPQEAEDLIQAGSIVAVVTIPADFDARIRQNAPVQIDVKVNNLNTDFTNDIRRAVPLSITSFYAKAFPNVVTISTHEVDLQPQDTDYIPYLTVSMLVLALAIGGMLQAGSASAREWEKDTIKEILLSPANRIAVVLGKMLATLVMGLLSVMLLLVILIFVVGIYPVHWDEVLGFTLLCLVIFVALGALIGTLIKHRLPVTALSAGISLPLFFISGPFGPLSLSTEAIQFLARLSPIYYGVVLEQHAFHGFTLNAYGIGGNVLILVGFALGLILLASLALRRGTVAH